MPLVSIVVPVYKVEKYLERCINSLVAQTLRDIEIILVNDGSPDTCPEICDAWKECDSRIKVVHKKNGGLSSARNAGFKIATGKYVGFVDSDDDIEQNMYERMYDIITKEDVDFVMSDYIRVLEDGTSFLKTLDISGGRYDKFAIKKEIFPQLIMGENLEYGPLLSVCHCLYRTEFLKKNGLIFDEEVRWSEDNIFSAFVGYYADSFYYMKGEGLYHYYQNPGTISTAYRPGAWKVYCTMNKHMREFFCSVLDYDFNSQLNFHMLYYACNCIGMEIGQPKRKAIQDIAFILKSKELQKAFECLSIRKVPFKLRVQIWLMKYKMTSLLYYLKKV